MKTRKTKNALLLLCIGALMLMGALSVTHVGLAVDEYVIIVCDYGEDVNIYHLSTETIATVQCGTQYLDVYKFPGNTMYTDEAFVIHCPEELSYQFLKTGNTVLACYDPALGPPPIFD